MSGLGLDPSYMNIWACRSSLWSGSRNAWRQIKNVNSVSCLSNFWNFFSTIQMISCCDWWPWTKSGYITTTRRQTNNQWSGGIAAHPTPKKFWAQKSTGKVLTSIFWDQVDILLTDYLPKGQTINAEYYHLFWCKWRTFWRKNARRRSPRRFCSCMTMSQLTGHLQPRRNWPTWASNVLFTHPILRIWPLRTTTCSLDWKYNRRVAIFYPTQRSLLPRRPGWTDKLLNFFEWLAKGRAAG